MKIGGGSTSTAGGIKVTTFVVLLPATIDFFRRRGSLQASGRSVPPDQVHKALALVTVSGLSVVAAIFAIPLIHGGPFPAMAFEAAPAFGTTGLSRGATAQPDALGRVVIMALMFFGRVGPLTLGSCWRRARRRATRASGCSRARPRPGPRSARPAPTAPPSTRARSCRCRPGPGW
ncbi:potassium transporter TrkG [Halovulum marinum]